MAVDPTLLESIEALALAKGKSLPSRWSDELEDAEFPGGAVDVAHLCVKAGWPAPVPLGRKPRPDQFPLLVYDGARGWAVAEQWESDAQIRLAGLHAPLLDHHDQLVFFDIRFPDPLQGEDAPKASTIFWRAILRRKHVLVSAGLATLFANLLTLATSIYSMQVYDRVIPLASYATLIVITIGTAIAIGFDFVLRSIRGVMIEREAAEIDAEVSEYFFARSQAVRLDARPPGVGTMAAQLRGLEQVRSVMSSGSLFLLADLPFALFFIFVIASIGGVVALVPLISLPIAIGMALVLSRMIKKGTDRAQVSGNYKNGLLVESLDAAETIKASRGGWFMLARWNRLINEVHHYEDPVKRASAVANTVFASMQQFAFVALMAVGAIEVSRGNLTAGGLLACSIIAGRINGPLVAMLPSLMVQWGYARSSLHALDQILKLPVDRGAGDALLRPDNLAGPLQADGLRFMYPGAREGIELTSLEIVPGERIAIVGGVGSGKSTLLRLLSGIYEPQAGTLKLNGLDLRQIAEDVLRQHVGYLPQDFRLVNGTLRDNLTMGLGGVGDETIMAAAAQTGLADMITGHPLGLDLPIQEGGRGLSGGQRSLTGLTRLLLEKPGIWLLDEPTSNLDQASEAAVLQAMNSMIGKDQTLVFVTHKLQLLTQFERILVMSKGRVVLDGPAKEVLARLQPKTVTRSVSPIAANASS